MDVKKLIEEVLTALGDNKSLIDVSSKIQIIVRLLGDEKLRTWYDCEFVKGYLDEDVPDYRISSAAEIKADYLAPQGTGAWNMTNQSVPVANLGMEKYDEIMTIKVKDNISSIIEYSKHPNKMVMTLSPYETALVQKVLGYAHIRSVYKVVPPSVFQTIIDNVQNRIIDLFMDLNEKIFNGELDIATSQGKKEITQVVNNYITAGVVQTGYGTIDASHSSIAANLTNEVNAEIKEKLNAIIDELELIVKKNDKDNIEFSKDLTDIRTELQTTDPEPRVLKKSFKALVWGASVSCKAAIEKLVGDAIDLLSGLVM